MNPLWDIAHIPSGKSVTDMVRAIRLHLYKVHRYKVLIEAYRNKEEVKLAPDNGGWSEEQRLEWVRDQLDTQFMGFRSHSYEDGFLAFLICRVTFLQIFTVGARYLFLFWYRPRMLLLSLLQRLLKRLDGPRELLLAAWKALLLQRWRDQVALRRVVQERRVIRLTL
jgi:hypothetical protein